MGKMIMLKVFFRALLAAAFVIAFTLILLHYTLLTLAILIVSWFILMLHIDPPSNWDK